MKSENSRLIKEAKFGFSDETIRKLNTWKVKIYPPIKKVTVHLMGGGWDSIASGIMILMKEPRVKEYWDIESFIFCDTGDEKEHTYRILREMFIPMCEKAGIPFHWLKHPEGSLYDRFKREFKVPLGWADNTCSSSSKRVISDAFLRETYGIDTNEGKKLYGHYIQITEIISYPHDEEGRNATLGNRPELWRNRISLLDILKLRKIQLYQIYKQCGLLPQLADILNLSVNSSPKQFMEAMKSSCWYCPNAGLDNFKKLKEEEPEKFKMALDLEENAKLGKWDNPPTFIQDHPLIRLEMYTSIDEFFEREIPRELVCSEVCGY